MWWPKKFISEDLFSCIILVCEWKYKFFTVYKKKYGAMNLSLKVTSIRGMVSKQMLFEDMCLNMDRLFCFIVCEKLSDIIFDIG